MAIRTIEIVCRPCFKCEKMKKSIFQAIKTIQLKYKIKIQYEFKHTPSLLDINKYGLNPSQIPAVIVNGKPEFGGNILPLIVTKKLEALHIS